MQPLELTPAAAAASSAEGEIAGGRYRGPLQGISIGVKEIYDVAGVPSTSSSRARARYLPDEDSAVVARRRAAGAVVVGRTHSHEFAYGVVTPQTRNPWRPDPIAGGSGGGSAAAVATGQASQCEPIAAWPPRFDPWAVPAESVAAVRVKRIFRV